jgi:hypothetical protein
MQWMIWAAVAMWAIDYFGRRKLMLFGESIGQLEMTTLTKYVLTSDLVTGAAGQSLCFAVAAIGLGLGTKASNGVAVAFIFLFYFFFVSDSRGNDWSGVCLTRATRDCLSSPSLSYTPPKSTRIDPAMWAQP